MRKLHLMLYYGIARHMPASDRPFSFGAKAFRGFLARRLFASSGSDINVERGVFFGDGSRIELGDESGLGLNAWMSGPVRIGRQVMMGPEVMIYTSNHAFNRTDVPMIRQGNTEPEPVVIEDDVWIGARAILLPGVRVGQGSVVAAGSVVTRDVPPYSVVGGNPARVLKSRDRNE